DRGGRQRRAAAYVARRRDRDRARGFAGWQDPRLLRPAPAGHEDLPPRPREPQGLAAPVRPGQPDRAGSRVVAGWKVVALHAERRDLDPGGGGWRAPAARRARILDQLRRLV